MKALAGYKTIAVNVAAFAVLAINYATDNKLIPEAYMPLAAGALTLINLSLRFVTTTPVFKSEPVQEEK